MNLVQIVPALAPAINGVGDHARLLAAQLRQDYGVTTHFIVGDPAWAGPDSVEGFPVTRVTARTPAALITALITALATTPADTVLVHYVGYGYATRGCPMWLISGLTRWRRATPAARLVTFAHELYATGPVWSSAFWLSPIQRSLITRLACASDALLTSRQGYADRLAELTHRPPTAIPLAPIFSSMGEPDAIAPVSHRPGRLIVFGHPGARAALYHRHLPTLRQVCTDLEITELCEMGLPAGVPPPALPGVTVTQQGVLPAPAISAHLLTARAAVTTFPPPILLAKSAVFAAYCAHGLLTVHTDPGPAADGLAPGRHYWVAGPDAPSLDLDTADRIAAAAHAWYQPHRLAVQAAIFHQHILPQPTTAGASIP